jgi:hypothetical protein
VDNVLIDEARTPLIISGPSSGDLEWYGKMAQVVKQLKPEDYEVNEKDRNVSITEIGLARVEQMLGQPLMDPDRPEDVTPQQARLRGYLEQALRAQFLFHRNKEYLVQAGKVVIVDDFTGRLMPGRRWSDGLHQAVEAKEGVKVEPENVTYATITLQNYFRMYKKLAGMTGTALTEAEEFDKIYKLEVVPVPPNLEYQAFGKDAPLIEIQAKDEEGYAYSYFAKRDSSPSGAVPPLLPPQGLPRCDLPHGGGKTALHRSGDRARTRARTPAADRHHLRGSLGTPLASTQGGTCPPFAASRPRPTHLDAKMIARRTDASSRNWRSSTSRSKTSRRTCCASSSSRSARPPSASKTPPTCPIVLDILRLEESDVER